MVGTQCANQVAEDNKPTSTWDTRNPGLGIARLEYPIKSKAQSGRVSQHRVMKQEERDLDGHRSSSARQYGVIISYHIIIFFCKLAS